MNENGEENGNGGQKPELTRREQEILACVAVGMRNDWKKTFSLDQELHERRILRPPET